MLNLKYFVLFVVVIAMGCMPVLLSALNPVAETYASSSNSRDLLQPPDDLSVRLEADMIILSWAAVPFADTYKVEFTVLPYYGFMEITGAGHAVFTSTTCTWTVGLAQIGSDFNSLYFQVRSVDLPTPGDLVIARHGTFSYSGADVRITSFVIDRFEVTQSSYLEVMNASPSCFSGNPYFPVEQVSWFNAIEYCNRRSVQEGFTPCYSYAGYGTNPSAWPAGWNTNSDHDDLVSCDWYANGYRLPTEAEWHYAASGGRDSHHYVYSGSDFYPGYAWCTYTNMIDEYTHEVGLLHPNELGLYDMSGNMGEWTWDTWYYNGTNAALIDPHEDHSPSAVLKGGFWAVDFSMEWTVFDPMIDGKLTCNPVWGFRVCRRH